MGMIEWLAFLVISQVWAAGAILCKNGDTKKFMAGLAIVWFVFGLVSAYF